MRRRYFVPRVASGAALVLLALAGFAAAGCSSNDGPTAGNIGVPCTADGDCLDGLRCGTTGLPKGLCTTACTPHPNPDDCATQFHTDAFCGADDQCLLDCLTADRCFTGSTCDRSSPAAFCRKKGTKGP